MTGYQEILTDPSYARQIVTLTYPHVGNTGVTPEDLESDSIHAAGLVIRDLPLLHSNWRASESLPSSCARQHRRDRRHRHAQAHPHPAREGRAGRLHRERPSGTTPTSRFAAARALSRAEGHGSREGRVGATPYQWNEGSIWREQGACRGRAQRLHVVAYDFGIKRNILRLLADRGCRVTVVPAQTTRRRRARAEARRRLPVQRSGRSGAVRLRDRGDPRVPRRRTCRCSASASATSCSGSRAARRPQDEVRPSRREPSGAGSRQRPRDDHQPEPRLRGRRVDAAARTSSRRTVRCSTARCRASRCTDRPAFSFQGHPEASPGPHDLTPLFDQFVESYAAATAADAAHAQVGLTEGVAVADAKAHRPQEHPDHRRRPDRHRPGLRVRLFRRAGLQGAARGGLPRHPRQLEPGDDHDRPGDGRRRSTSSRSTGARSRASSRRSGPTRCCRRWAARRRSTARSTSCAKACSRSSASR